MCVYFLHWCDSWQLIWQAINYPVEVSIIPKHHIPDHPDGNHLEKKKRPALLTKHVHRPANHRPTHYFRTVKSSARETEMRKYSLNLTALIFCCRSINWVNMVCCSVSAQPGAAAAAQNHVWHVWADEGALYPQKGCTPPHLQYPTPSHHICYKSFLPFESLSWWLTSVSHIKGSFSLTYLFSFFSTLLANRPTGKPPGLPAAQSAPGLWHRSSYF